ncbi:hypothetical protein Syun_027885 [Stephania yunnanensis]|uniref:Pentatricopeptide repeat-containing protein n=1 Tax=Stephania yunnanensis TaxID=152371 RepID=A0AAP0EGR2_9MAGN
MRREGLKPNEVTLASLLSACGNVVILEQGKQLHALVLSLGLDEDVLISSALINMYSKCGSIVEALRIFEATGNEEIVSWTAMINGFAEHGHSKEAIDLFEREKESERDFAMRERGDEEEKKSLQKFFVEAKRWRRLSTYIGLGDPVANPVATSDTQIAKKGWCNRPRNLKLKSSPRSSLTHNIIGYAGKLLELFSR